MIDKRTEEIMKKWRIASNTLVNDPLIKVICPFCGKDYLQVKDENVPNTKKIDRYMMCNNCKNWNVVTFEKKEL